MGDTVRALNVEIALSDKNFSKNITAINKQLKNLDNEFKMSAKEFGKFENSMEGLTRKSDLLNKKLDLQKTKHQQLEKVVATNSAELEKYKKRLEDNKSAIEKLNYYKDIGLKTYVDEEGAIRNVAEELKKHQQELEQNTQQVNKWENELVRSEQALRQSAENIKQFENAVEETSRQLNNFGADAFKKKIEAIGDSIQKTGDKIKGFGNKTTELGKNLATKITAPIVAVGGVSSKVAIEYEQSLAKLNTMAKTAENTGDSTHKSIKVISDEVIQFSSKTGMAATEVNEALYSAISAGVDTADAFTFLETANKGAVAGFADLGVAVDALSSFMNIYGLSMEEVNNVANQMLITQNLGKTSFTELGAVIGEVAPVAKQLGINTDELLSSFASLTANGLQTSKSATGLKAAFSNLIKPSSEAQKKAKELGITFDASTVKSKGWQGTLSYINEAVRKSSPEYAKLQDSLSKTTKKMQELEKQNKTGTQEYKELQSELGTLQEKLGSIGGIDEFAKLFGSVEGLNAMMVLTSEGGASLLNETLQEMKTNTTQLDKSFKTMDETTQQDIKKAMTNITNAMIQVGQVFLPVIGEIAKKISEMATKFQELDPKTKNFIIFGGLAVAVIAPLLILIGSFITAIGAVVGGFGALVSKSSGVLGVFGKFGNSTNSLSKIFGSFTGKLKKGGDSVSSVANTFKNVSKSTDGVGQAMANGGRAVGQLQNPLKTLVNGGILMVLVANLDNIINALSGAIKAIGDFIVQISAVDISNFIAIMDKVKETIATIMTPVRLVAESIKLLVQNIGSIITSLATGISTILTSVFNGLVSVISTVANSIATVITSISNGISNVISTVYNSISNLIATVSNSISTVALSVSYAFSNAVNSVGNCISNIASSVSNGISNVVNTVSNSINGLINSVSNGISNVISSIGNAFKNAGEGLKLAGEGGMSAKTAFEGLSKINFKSIIAVSAIDKPLKTVGEALKTIGSANSAITVLKALGTSATGVKGLDTSVKGVSTSLSKINSNNVNSLNTAIKSASTSVKSLQTSLQGVSRVSITGILNQLKTISTNAKTSSTSVSSLASSINKLSSSKVSTVASAINTIRNNANNAKSSVVSLQTAINNLKGKTVTIKVNKTETTTKKTVDLGTVKGYLYSAGGINESLENAKARVNPTDYLLTGSFYSAEKENKNDESVLLSKILTTLKDVASKDRQQVINIDNMNLNNVNDERNALNRLRFFACI